jgi:hypothetical protein
MAAKKKNLTKETETPSIELTSPQPVQNIPSNQPSLDDFLQNLTGPKYVGGVKHFTKHDLLKFELLQTKTFASLKDAQLKQLEIEKFVKEANEKAKVMNDELEMMKKTYSSNFEKLSHLSKDIENTYKISLNSITYDDSDGRIFEHFQFKKE